MKKISLSYYLIILLCCSIATWLHGYMANPVFAQEFTSAREIKTFDTTPAVSDYITAPAGGSFTGFSGLALPFVQDLLKYLAGPHQTQPDLLGPLAKLTPKELQDKLRYDYWQKCVDGTYCSSKNIPSEKCPNESANECLLANGLEIFELQPYEERWNEIPLVANPITKVEEAIAMDGCPQPVTSTTDTSIKVPWIAGLKNTAEILHELLMPRVESPENESRFNLQKPCPEPIPNFVAETQPSDPVEITGNYAFIEPGKDPVWAKVNFPFLQTIYNYLSGPNGVFRIFNPEPPEEWSYAAQSPLKYTDPAGVYHEVKTYPPFLGGIYQAKEWLLNTLLPKESS